MEVIIVIHILQRTKKRSSRRAFSEIGDASVAGEGDQESDDDGEEGDEDEVATAPEGSRGRRNSDDGVQMVVDGSGNETTNDENVGDEDQADDGVVGANEGNIDTTTAAVMHRRKIRRKHSTKQKVPELLPSALRFKLLGSESEGDGFSGFNTNDGQTGELSGDSFALRKRRMYSHFEDFVNCYFHS